MSHQQPYRPEESGSSAGADQQPNPYVQAPVNPYEQAPQGPQAPQPYANPYGYAPVLPDHPQATTVLILGILAMVLGGITGPFAWVMGQRARREVQANPTAYRDGGMLTVGWVLGIVGTCYLALLVLFIIVYAIIIVAVLTQLPS